MSISQTRLSPSVSAQPENALSEGFRGNWEKKREGAVGKEERETMRRNSCLPSCIYTDRPTESTHARARPILPLLGLACLPRSNWTAHGRSIISSANK